MPDIDSLQSEITYPLAPMQAGMLFHSLYAQRPGVDIEQMVCTLREPLNLEVFEQAWQQLVQRHAVLRTNFQWRDLEQPEQRVHQQVKLEFTQQNWGHLSPQAQRDNFNLFLKHDRQQGFDLQQAPLMRLALFQMAEAQYQLVWTIHHILLDGRSFLVLLKEVFAIYEALCQSQTPTLAPLHPYQDYITWLQQQDWSQAEPYWRHWLSDLKVSPFLRVDGSEFAKSEFAKSESRQACDRNLEDDFGHAQVKRYLSEQTTTALTQLAQQHSITLNTIVQGAWALLLQHYSASDDRDGNDIVFGTIRACRHAPVTGAELMVGVLINTVPVRVRVVPDTSLLTWLQEIRNQHLAIRPYEHTPLAQIQQWSNLPAGTPLFESLVVFENYSFNTALQSEGDAWKNREFQLIEQPSYPLVLNCTLDSTLLLKILYDRQRFTSATITGMLERLQALLEQIVAAPNCQLADLSCLTATERQRILVDWNATKVEYPQHLRLHDLFESQVVRAPDAVAVVFDGKSLTYGELNHRANQLAHALQKRGIRPEVPVGICIERSLEMIVGLLAIVKAGGAYVPLDPTYPPDRLTHILSDSQLAVVLTQEKFLSLLPEPTIPKICLDRDCPILAVESSENPVSSATSRHLAYIIYTSGSTGKPKGVLIEHRSAMNTILDINRRFQVNASDRVLSVCSLNFDLSVYDVFGVLAVGGTVIVPQPAIAPDLDHWLDLMEQYQVTLWNSAPPVMQMLVGHSIDRCRTLPADLRLVLLSGDWIPVTLPGLVRQLKTGQEKVAIISLGGATEASIWSIFYPIEDIAPGWKSIPYGKPLANQQFYVLNERLQPVPVGKVGELYIGGDGVARGYLNRPDLNQTKFIADPFRPEAGTLYRTGDLGRYQSDGTIEFLGRIDYQVKIRGFRVELGEIEVVLSQHPAIRETVVLTQDDEMGNKRLVAYWVSERSYVERLPTELLSTGQLINLIRSFLQAKLPHYMIPSVFVHLDALPLTPNGKLDRHALPIPDLCNSGSNSTSDNSCVAARNPIEQQLVAIWQACLKVKPISVTDNFFELGGHSLLAVQLWSQIEKTFNTELPLFTLFQSPTIEQLARQLVQTHDSPEVPPCPSLVVIQPGQADGKPPLFCIHVLGRGLKFYRPMLKYIDPQQTVYGLSTHIAGEAFPSNQVEDLAAHYLQQIRMLQPEGPYFLAGISFGGLVAFEIAQQLHAQNQEVALLALMDTQLSQAFQRSTKSYRLATHRSQLLQKGVGYLFEKTQQWLTKRTEDLTAFLRNPYYRLGAKIYHLIQQPIPEDWQDFLHEAQNKRATATYTPKVYAGNITLYKATDQRIGAGTILDPTLGWQHIVLERLEVYEIPGNHLGMLQEPSAQALGTALQSSLARATR